MANFYDVLHVSRDAPRSLIRASYDILARNFKANPHLPAEKPAALRRIETAFEVLYDPERRKKYDDLLLKQEKIASLPATDTEAIHQTPSPQPLPPETQDTGKETLAQHQPAQAIVEDDPSPMDDLYRAFIGLNSQQYYLYAFREFDRQKQEGRLSWFGKFNIAAGLFGAPWFWYRKMYANLFVLLLLQPILLGAIARALFPGYALFVQSLLFVSFGLTANRLYYNACRKRIGESSEIAPHSDRIAYLSRKGQTTYAPAYWMAAIVLIGTLASILVPAMEPSTSRNKQQRAQEQSSVGDEQPVDWSQFTPVDGAAGKAKGAASAEDKWWEKDPVVPDGQSSDKNWWDKYPDANEGGIQR